MPGQSKDFKRKVGKNVGSDNSGYKSQYSTPYGTYLGDYGTPRNPDFLVSNPKELEAMIRQRNQSLYGGLTASLRESLGSAGLLSSGALPEALAGAQIGLGQQVAGDINNLYMSELERKRQFDAQRALLLLNADIGKGQQDQQNSQDFLNTLLSAGGTIGKAAVGLAFPPAAAVSALPALQNDLAGPGQIRLPQPPSYPVSYGYGRY